MVLREVSEEDRREREGKEGVAGEGVEMRVWRTVEMMGGIPVEAVGGERGGVRISEERTRLGDLVFGDRGRMLKFRSLFVS